MNDNSGERRRRPRGRLTAGSDALYRTLRFVAGHVQGFYAAYAAFLTLAFLGAAAFAAFIGFGKLVAEGVTLSFDDSVLRWFAAHRTATATYVALSLTSLGSEVVLIALVLVASVFLWATRHHYSVYLLLIGAFGAWGLSALLKEVFERPRPSIVSHLVIVHSDSFPSGHAMHSMVVYASIALLVARLAPGRSLRTLTWTVAILLIAGIGTSRLYLGVHYPSDVAAGYVAGLAWIAFVAAGLAGARYLSARNPAIESAERDLHADPP